MRSGKTISFTLNGALDFDSTALTYSVVSMPTHGALSDCLGGTADLSCKYVAPSDFTGEVKFSYKANDGTSDSNTREVSIHVLAESLSIVDISSSHYHSCALFDNKKIKCWGRNSSGQLGYGHRDHIGNDELASAQGFLDVGGDVLSVVIGSSHTCALLVNKTVKCWGDSRYGQLGRGISYSLSSIPSTALDLNYNVKQLVAGGYHTCVLFENGRVKCWGRNNHGQLGLGHTTNVGDSSLTLPKNIPFTNVGGKVLKLSAGPSHTCALLKGGNLKCWGQNNYGQLGYGHRSNIGDNEHPLTAGNVNVGARVIDMVLGGESTCVTLSDMTVKCWGRNNYGQLGYGHTDTLGDNELPSTIGTLNLGGRVDGVVISFSHACAVLENNKMKCWGSGPVNSKTPRAVLPQENFADVSAGIFNSCALSLAGDVRCWGERNSSGQLGLGHTSVVADDVFLFPETSTTFSAGGRVVLARFDYEVDATNPLMVSFDTSKSFAKGTIASYAWSFGDGMTGTGSTVSHTFANVGGYTVGLTVTDNFGQTHQVMKKVVLKAATENSVPILVKGGVPHPIIFREQYLSVRSGKTISFTLNGALDFDSTALTYSVVSMPTHGALSDCLGGTADLSCKYVAPSDFTGEVKFSYKANDGTSDSNTREVSIHVLAESLSIVDISSSHYHSCALFDNKKIKCWGRNSSGQLGYGHRDHIGNDELASAQGFLDVGGDVLSVVIGSSHTCALLVNKTVKCWGDSRYGQLGRGISYSLSSIPSTALDLNYNVKQLVAGGYHTCVLFENGRVKCWGRNNHGQLGLGHTTNVGDSSLTLPKNIPFTNVGGKVLKLSAGPSHTCALLKGGNLKCWGQNNYGQLGYGHRSNIGDNEHPLTAGNVNVGARVIDMVLGGESTCVTLSDMTVKCWGRNNYGQLGYGHTDTLGDNELPSTIGTLNLGGRVDGVVISFSHACAVLENNKMKCWGSGPVNSKTPRAVLPQENFADVSAGIFNSCALSLAGDVRCWGERNSSGQLGLGHTSVVADDVFLFPETSTTFSAGGRVVLARFDYEVDATNPLMVSFDTSKSFAKGTIASYAWSFGDGMTGTGSTVSHTFANVGGYTVGLTVTDNFGQTHQVMKKVVLKAATENSVPILVKGGVPHPIIFREQYLSVRSGKTISFTLNGALDFDSTALTYSVVSMPTHGALSDCLGGTADLSCKYVAPSDFTGEVKFSYKANDGTSDSNTREVSIHVLAESLSIVDISSSHYHSCALFDNKKIKCWGRNSSGQLGYGHRDHIGNDELASAQGFLDVGGDVLSVVIGSSHTCALLVNKTVKCWGDSRYGQLGRGISYSLSSIPSTALDLNYNVKQLVAGGYHTCVLFENGRVKCWGRNNHGQLGLGHTTNVGDSSLTLPKNIPFTNVGGKVLKLSAGPSHTCALLKGGNLKCWGQNNYGQLGYGHRSNIGDNEHPLTAGNVNVGARVIDMVLGGESTCVTLSDMTVKCWGRNNYGQLGYGHTDTLGDNELPSTIGTLNLGGRVDGVVISFSHACAVLENNKMKCWGSGPVNSKTPRAVLPQENFADVSAGIFNSCALSLAGDVRCWGERNSSGQLGLGHTSVVADDVFLFPETSTTFSAGGRVVLARFDYEVDATNPLMVSFDTSKSFAKGTIASYAWSFGDGMTGTGSTVSHTFANVGGYTVGLTVTDNFGQTHQVMKKVVLKAATENSVPILVKGGVPHPIIFREQYLSVRSGKTISFTLNGALDFDSTALTYSVVSMPTHGALSDCLGGTADLSCKYVAPSDFTGEVKFSYKANDGTSDSNTREVSIHVLAESLSIVDISSSHYHSCALFDNKKIKCWGRNSSGQLGYGHRDHIGNDELASAQGFLDVGGDVLSVVIGSSHTCALLVNKTVKCWGDSRYGQLGRGISYSLSSIPSTALDLNYNVKQLVAGGYHTCVLFENGRVKCWGRNNHGQLGLGHTTNVGDSSLTLPKNIPFTNVGGKVLKLSAGPSHTCALLKGGNLKCWGQNNYGQLGYGHRSNIGDNEHPLTAGNVNVGARVIDMVLGGESTCVTLSDMTVKCWGRNNYGQLGYGHTDTLGDNELPSTIGTLNLGGRVDGVVISFSHACAVLENNKMKCWGSGPVNSKTPRAVLPQENFADVSAGIFNSCALSLAGDVRCWGERNSSGQLGLGHTSVVADDVFLFPETSTTFSAGGRVVLARFDYEVDATNPLMVSFDTSKSFAKGTIASYAWSFGDGMTGTGSTVSHTFANVGGYTVGLTVTDNFGQTHQVMKKVVLKPVNENSVPVFSELQSFTVLSGQSLTFNLNSALDFDSTALTYSVVDMPPQGTLSGCLGGTADLSCSYLAPSDFTGEVIFTYKANDGMADSLPATVRITVSSSFFVDRENIIGAEGPTVENFDFSHDFLSKEVFFDASYSFREKIISDYFWDFGDGNTATEQSVWHSFESAGSYIVILTVTDFDFKIHRISQEIILEQNDAYEEENEKL